MSYILSDVLTEREQQAPPALYDQMRWYACYTNGRHEKRVAALFVRRGIESYLPLVTCMRRGRDRSWKVALPAFPSYVFGRFALRDLHCVLTTFGVATVVRVNGYPTPIPDTDIERVRQVIERAETFGLEPQMEELAEGERVRIVGGALRGVEGVLVQRRGRKRVLVGISAIGHGLSVEVEHGHVKPLAPPR